MNNFVYLFGISKATTLFPSHHCLFLFGLFSLLFTQNTYFNMNLKSGKNCMDSSLWMQCMPGLCPEPSAAQELILLPVLVL